MDQKKYTQFVNAINRGFGWIDPEDVSRQWEGMFCEPLKSLKDLKELLTRLETDLLLREDKCNSTVSDDMI